MKVTKDTLALVRWHWDAKYDEDAPSSHQTEEREEYAVVWLEDALASGMLDPDQDGDPKLHRVANVDDCDGLAELFRDAIQQARHDWADAVDFRALNHKRGVALQGFARAVKKGRCAV